MKFSLPVIALILITSCGRPTNQNPQIRIYTSVGDMEAELYPDKAPKTVNAFLQNIDAGVYTNTSFYRVLYYEGATTAANTGLVQAGTWPSDNHLFSFVKNIPHEPTSQTRLTHTNGVLSMARTTAGTASTEFFICIGDQSTLDAGGNTPADKQGFAAFGQVTNGMDIVRKIQIQPSNGGDGFKDKIQVYKIIRL